MATPPTFITGQVLTAAQMNTIAMHKIGTFTASGSSTDLICDNIFTTEYQNYKLIINMNTASTSNWLWLQYINSSGTVVGAGYYGAFYGQDYATASTTQFGIWRNVVLPLGYAYFDSTLQTGIEMTIYDPIGAGATTHNGNWTGIEGGVRYAAGTTVGSLNGTSVRGIRIGNNGGTNITGTVRVYGYRN